MLHLLHFYQTHKELNKFYLASFIRRIGLNLIGIFVPIYLYHTGYSVIAILFFYFIQSLSFILFSFVGGKILSKIGYKFGILLSTPVLIVMYFFLNSITQYPLLFFITPILAAIANFLFYISYHNVFTQESHSSKRGSEVAILNIAMVIAGAIAPFIGGIIAEVNFSTLFFISSIFIFISSLPFLFIDNIQSEHHFSIKSMLSYLKKKKYYGDFISFSAYGAEHIVDFILWPLFIVFTVHNLEKTGVIVSITSIISIIVYYIFGKLSDSLQKKKLVAYTSYFYALFFVVRIFSRNMQQLILFDSLKAISQKAIMIPFSTRIYELIEASPNYLEFSIIKENSFNFIRILFIPILMLIFTIGVHPFIVSFALTSLIILAYRFMS